MMKWSNCFNAILFQAAGGGIHVQDNEVGATGEAFNKFMDTKLIQAMTTAKGTTAYHQGTDGLTTVDSVAEPRFVKMSPNAGLSRVSLEQLAFAAGMQALSGASVSTSEAVHLPSREKWRAKVAKSEFYTLKDTHAIAFVQEILTFKWSAEESAVGVYQESKLLVRWARPTGQDACTKFTLLTLDPEPSAMLSFSAIAAPLHAIRSGTDSFILNDTFYE